LQFERGEALEKITQSVKAKLEEENDEDSLKFLSKTVDTVRKQVDHIVVSKLERKTMNKKYIWLRHVISLDTKCRWNV
jgi:hypothetical protein